MSSITSVAGSTPATTTAAPSSSSAGAVPASVSAGLSVDAGVIATLSEPAAPGSDDLYTNLASLSTVSTASSGVDLNQQWANAVSANPSLAPLAEQMAATEALLSAVL
jgi:hypothetical protein